MSSVPELDLTAPASQEFFAEFCNDARQVPALRTRPELSCWVETFKSDFLNAKDSNNASGTATATFPVPSTSFAANISSFLKTTPGGKFINEFDIDPVKPLESKITWVSMNLRIDVNVAADAKVLQPIWNVWKQFVYDMNQKAPESVGPAIMTSDAFTKMDQKLALMGSTINGFITSNIICLAAVLLFTGDLVISIYTMLSIVLIVLTLLGFLFGVLGWTFGAIEAVGVTIFVGMSVDYCLHTAHGYAHSSAPTRRGKVTEALTHVGVSILGAFFTTAGATLFLLPTWIYLFYQLGVMMLANTILAVLFSFFFLSTILMLMGPTYGCGQVTSIISCRCLRNIGKKRHADGTEVTEEEEEEEDWDPDSLVGQIEAEQKREEEAARIRLIHMQIESHNRVKQRLLKRKLSQKKKTAVTPVQAPSEVVVKKEQEEEDDGMSI
jgi:hypothetical protein